MQILAIISNSRQRTNEELNRLIEYIELLAEIEAQYPLE